MLLETLLVAECVPSVVVVLILIALLFLSPSLFVEMVGFLQQNIYIAQLAFVFMAIIGILYIDKACKMIGKSIEYVLSSSIVCVLAVVQNYVYYAKIMIAVGTITGNKIVTLLYVLMFAVIIFLMMCFICNVPFDKFGRRKIFIFSLVGIMLTIINLYI